MNLLSFLLSQSVSARCHTMLIIYWLLQPVKRVMKVFLLVRVIALRIGTGSVVFSSAFEIEDRRL